MLCNYAGGSKRNGGCRASFSRLSTSLHSLWRNVRKTVESLSSVPDSLPEIRSTITHANSSLARYRSAWQDMEELFVLGRGMFKDEAEKLRSQYEHNIVFAQCLISEAEVRAAFTAIELTSASGQSVRW